MRLIDADKIKSQIAAMAIANAYPTNKANALCELIDAQPTSYDVDKVVEQISALPTIPLWFSGCHDADTEIRK